MDRIRIPDAEYAERARRAGELMAERGLDVLILNGNEADYANSRYFSGFWPVFERAGVAIAPDGTAALLCGPESGLYAEDFGKIDNVFPMLEYRESADPAYPHMKLPSFKDVFASIGVDGSRALRIGVASVLDTNVVIWKALEQAFPGSELVDAREIMVTLRSNKSENEIACLREATRITQIATDDVIARMRPGMTELQLVGFAQASIYANGAEYEGLPMYCFSQQSTKHAISRSSYRQIKKGDIVQLNLSAAIDGYSPSIGMPISVGPLTGEKRDIVEFILDMHMWTERELRAGRVSGEIAQAYEDRFTELGRAAAYVYGPCHGLGLTEVEAPWMETISTYTLADRMTFQIDTFGVGSDFGVRWEKPCVIREGGIELLSDQIGAIHEIDC